MKDADEKVMNKKVLLRRRPPKTTEASLGNCLKQHIHLTCIKIDLLQARASDL